MSTAAPSLADMSQANLFEVPASGSAPDSSECLRAWAPEQWEVASDWQPTLQRFWSSASAQGLARFVQDRLAAGATIYPPQPLRALALTALAQVRVVILGQDPYHGPGQAEGLAFSVAPGVRLPPSLRNIFKELARERAGQAPGQGARAAVPADGSLVRWAQQGVLLLNTCLTVEDGQPASHARQGWEALTDDVLKTVVGMTSPVVFMLWGAHAQRLGEVIRAHGDWTADEKGTGRHLVLTANHPSPLSALRPPQPFLGCGHFERANAFLQRNGTPPIAW